MKTQPIGALACGLYAFITISVASGQPGALREIWTNVSGSSIHSLEDLASYPSTPITSEIVTSLQPPENFHSYYGQRLRALLTPDQSGEYTFSIAANDSADLWLSTNASPSNAVRIARVTSATDPLAWNTYEGQQSEPISLLAGQQYYIEVIHKEHSGSDHLAVGWSLGGNAPSVIGAAHLTAWADAAASPPSGLHLEAGAPVDLWVPALELDLAGQVLDQTGVSGGVAVTWSGAGVVFEDARDLDTTATFAGPGSYTLTLTATKRDITETDTLAVTVHPRLAADSGRATQQFWFDIRGEELDDLTSHLRFPLYPDMVRDAEALEGPYNFFYYYGTRTIGYLLPPRSGTYRFYLSGDNSAKFALSTDASPANLVDLSEVTSLTARGDFFVDPDRQISDSVVLNAGERYYFELLHKEHSSNDHHSVYWGFEGEETVSLITGEFLAPADEEQPNTPELDTTADYIVFAGQDQTLHLPTLRTDLRGFAVKRRWNAELIGQTWSVVGNSTGITFEDATDPRTSVTFPGEGSFTLQLEVVTDEETIRDEVTITILPALAEDTGLLTREVWFNRYFTSLDELRVWHEFPDAPHIVDSLPALRGPRDWSSKYATRVSGWLHVPETGDYTFYLTGDDEAEFRISSDESAENLALACRVPQATRTGAWFDFPEQRSEVIRLEAGRRYYVELLHRETWSRDHFEVAWTVGANREPQIIEGSYFSPAKAAPEYRDEVTFYAYAGADRKYYWPHDTTTLAGSIQKVRSSEAATTSLWEQVGGPAASLAGIGNLEAEATFPGQGRYVFRLTVTAEGVSHSDEVVIDVLPPIAEDTGSILRSVWLDISGYYVNDLLEHDPELAYPDFEDQVPGTETPEDWAHYYGTRLAGFLNVPTGGDYVFWIASNDTSELWLSSSTDPGAIRRIAYVSSAVSPGRWDYRDGQESVPISLAPGRYYIEARHKEHNSGDHLALAWEGPATNGREPISKGFVAPLRDAPVHNPNIQVVLGPDRVLLWPNDTLRLTGLVYDLEEGPSELSYFWMRRPGGSQALTFKDPLYPATDVVFAEPGIYEFGLVASDGANFGYDSIIVTVQDPLAPATGGILREVYTDISGYRISNLREAPSFPDSPTFKETISSFDAPVDWADNYGTRLRGFLRVPAAADYTFFIASDDASELWINPNGQSEDGKQLVAFTEYGTGRYRWNRYDSQQSEPIALQPGVSYYIEALHKAGTGGDYLSVAWRRSGDEEDAIQVIQGAMLIPFENAAEIDSEISINAGDDVTVRWPIEKITIRGTAIDHSPGPQPLATSWSVTRGPDGAEFALPSALQTEVRFPGPGKYTLQLTATDGASTRTDSLVVRVLDRLAPDTGSILCEMFEGISGYRVVDLFGENSYPDLPASRFQIKQLELPQNVNDTYGARVRGYLHPHASGLHRFNISGDDWAELYISTDETPENKELACFTPLATGYYEWLRFPEYQVSRPIMLKKGQKYYIEARLKEHSSRDHMSIAWHCPRSDGYEIIPGANLSPLMLADATAPVIEVVGAPEITLTVDSEFVDPGITANDDLDGDLTSNVRVEHNVDTSTPGTYTVRYTVVDAAGNEADEVVRRVHVVLADTPEAVYPPDTSGSHPPNPWTPPASSEITDIEASRFLLQSTFGSSEAEIARVKELGYEEWIDAQLSRSPSLHLPELDRYARFRGGLADTTSGMMMMMPMEMMPESMMGLPMGSVEVRDRMHVWWTHAIKAPDQLRQRVAFALSEILVISDRESELSRYPRGTTHYYDLLVRHAFGNYRDLLEDVTLNPMMGIWLTRIRSSKESPDENYPRELMQLFSIGLNHLNQDGSVKRGGDGSPLPTYGQEVILDLSRALTGWTYSGSQHFYYTPSTGVDSISPLIPFEDEHDRGAKTLLGGVTIPAGQTAMQDTQAVLDNIFDHPNIGPFICRRLIQRLVTSNPSPAYLYRVAGVFNDNGQGVRGDLGAVVKAILLGAEARTPANSTGSGKVREPILRLTHLLRACYEEPSSNPPTLGRFVIPDTTNVYGQAPLGAPTVFNFFEPDYSLPGALTDNGLFSPEFQIVTELSAVDIANHLHDGIRDGVSVRSNQARRIRFNLNALTALAGDVEALLDYAETVLVGRRLEPETRTELANALAPYAGDPERVARTLLQVLVATPEFSIQD